MKEQEYDKGFRDALLAVKSAKIGILGTASSKDTKFILDIVVDTVARSRNISLEPTPNEGSVPMRKSDEGMTDRIE